MKLYRGTKVTACTLLMIITWLTLLTFTLHNNKIEVQSLSETICQVQDSVVLVEVDTGDYYYDDYSSRSGSGVLVSNDGLILTAGHVVKDADVNDITVTFRSGLEVEVVDVYMEDPAITDLGLIRVKLLPVPKQPLTVVTEDDEIVTKEEELVFPQPCTFGTVRVGEGVFAIGEPFRLFQSVTYGIVSALDVDDKDDYFGEINLLQTDCPLNPGNSGCPILNLDGEIVAICVGGIREANNIAWGVPADICQLVIDKYLAIEALTIAE